MMEATGSTNKPMHIIGARYRRRSPSINGGRACWHCSWALFCFPDSFPVMVASWRVYSKVWLRYMIPANTRSSNQYRSQEPSRCTFQEPLHTLVCQRANFSGAKDGKNLCLGAEHGVSGVFFCFQKTFNKNDWPTLQFSSDETVACRVVSNEVHFFCPSDLNPKHKTPSNPRRFQC